MKERRPERRMTTPWLSLRRGDGHGGSLLLSLEAVERRASSNGERVLLWECHGDALCMSVPDR
jgi:hypothetical protein